MRTSLDTEPQSWAWCLQVFGQESPQEPVYGTAVQPLVEDAIEGYSCTAFAYGQTGTGKTHTMTGDLTRSQVHGILVPSENSCRRPPFSRALRGCVWLDDHVVDCFSQSVISSQTGDIGSAAGIAPRAVKDIFDTLQQQSRGKEQPRPGI